MNDKLWNLFFWVFGTIMFSVFVALIPGILLLLGELIDWVNVYANQYFDVSWTIRIPILLIIGFYLNSLNMKRIGKTENKRKKKK